MNRDIEKVQEFLDDIERVAAALRAHLPDIHTLAYDRTVTGGGGGGSGRQEWYLDEVGVGAARKLWHHASDQARRSAIELKRVEAGLRALTGGDGPARLRGTTITAAEHASAHEARERRLARAKDPATAKTAEYEPVVTRGLRQPGYPHPTKVTLPKTDQSEPKRKGWHR